MRREKAKALRKEGYAQRERKGVAERKVCVKGKERRCGKKGMRKGKGIRGHLSKLVRKRKCMVCLKESNAEKERTGEEKNGKKGKERKGKREENVAQGFFGSRRNISSVKNIDVLRIWIKIKH